MTDEPLGVAAALQHAEEDIRYPLGAPLSLLELAKDFAHSPNHQRKIQQLHGEGFQHFRRVRGDGNCFYRAVAFAWIESLFALTMLGQLQVTSPSALLPFGWPESKRFQGLAGEYHLLQQELTAALSPYAGGDEARRRLHHKLLSDPRFDLCLVVLLRLVVAEYCYGPGAGDEVLQSSAALHGGVENMIRTQVLPLGQEAEASAGVCVSRALQARMHIVQLDGSDGHIPTYVYPSEDYESKIRLCLLFRPGHYDLLYGPESPDARLRFQDPEYLSARCSFCLESQQLPRRGARVCGHLICASCSAQASRGSAGAECPICAEVPVPEEFRQDMPVDSVSSGLEAVPSFQRNELFGEPRAPAVPSRTTSPLAAAHSPAPSALHSASARLHPGGRERLAWTAPPKAREVVTAIVGSAGPLPPAQGGPASPDLRERWRPPGTMANLSGVDLTPSRNTSGGGPLSHSLSRHPSSPESHSPLGSQHVQTYHCPTCGQSIAASSPKESLPCCRRFVCQQCSLRFREWWGLHTLLHCPLCKRAWDVPPLR